MKTMPAGKFKAQCLSIMDEVNRTRQTVVITKRGKPVAKLAPVDAKADNVFGCLRHQIQIVGDIESPVVALEDWDALR
jgi:prevent-host-death family protein